MRVNKERIFRMDSQREIHPLKPIFRDYHKLTMTGHYEYPLHTHNNYELIIVESGIYRCWLNKQELALKRGGVVLIQPGDSHRDHLATGQIHYVLHFDLSGEDIISEEKNTRIFSDKGEVNARVIYPESPDLYQFFHWMEKHRETDNNASLVLPFIQDSLMETLFWSVLDSYSPELFSDDFLRLGREAVFERRLYDLFYSVSGQELNVTEMAEKMGLSERSFSRRCSEQFGISPARLFLTFRLREAALVLKTGEKRIHEVSEAFGFNNQFHFSRAFKRHYGVSPKEYCQSYR